MESTEHLLGDEKYQSCPQCENCGEHNQISYCAPHQRARYWLITFVIHTTIIILSIFTVNLFFGSAQTNQKTKQDSPIDHDKHLVGSVEAPLGYHERLSMKIENVAPDAWSNPLFFGEPNYDSDWAWLNMSSPRTFRLHQDEAERLNFTDSVRVKPGEDFSAMLGVMHNLHCLRRLRQMLYPDYYYPDESEEMKAHNFGHALHCLEALRSSVMCYPDMNLHPFFWSGMKFHDITVSAKVTRQCVDWEYLQERLEPRSVKDTELMRGTGPPN